MSAESSMIQRTISRLNGYLFDSMDPVMARIYSPYKAPLFTDSIMAVSNRGSILEIGAGAGANFRYFPPDTRLDVVEPCAAMHAPLQRRACAEGIQIALHDCGAETLPFVDEQFDLVISSLVLCTVQRPSLVLSEVLRVLKPNAKFLFLEHVKAERFVLRTYQKLASWPWKMLFCGCRLEQDTRQMIEAAGFSELQLSQFCFRVPLLPFAPHVFGWGRK